MRRAAAIGACLLLASAAGARAASPGVDLDVAPGPLRVEAPDAVALPTVRPVPGRTVVAEAPMGPLRVVDARGTGGWTLVVVGEEMVDALDRPLEAWLEVVPPAELPPGALPGAGGTLDRPRTVAEVPPGVVVPRATLWPGLRLRVPGDSPSGTYRATVTVTIS